MINTATSIHLRRQPLGHHNAPEDLVRGEAGGSGQRHPESRIPAKPLLWTARVHIHLDPAKTIVKWEWDLDRYGTYDISLTGPVVTTSFPTMNNYPVGLRVTDSAGTTATTTVTVLITTPPIAPRADAGGLMCSVWMAARCSWMRR